MNCVELNNISVKFRLYHEKAFTLKEKVINIIKRRNTYEDFYAIRNLSLSVKRGETLGIIGENGSGKSTLLKLICGVLKPCGGNVQTTGSISALLELGAGFDPDLTGRENIFLNGSLMGFSKKEMQKKFKQIVEFSELENFIDIPVKNYSSGMYMRLGFAIAVDVNPEILIIDEILAVGDASFQKKCVSKIKDFKNQGKTIIMVSHSHDMIKEFCSQAVWLKNGAKVLYDSSERVIYEYLRSLQDKEKQKFEDKITADTEEAKCEEPKTAPEPIKEPIVETAPAQEEAPVVDTPPPEPVTRWGSCELTIDAVEFSSYKNEKKNVFNVGEDFYVKLKYTAKSAIDNPAFGIQIFREDGRYIHGTSTFYRKVKTGIVSGSGEVLVKYKDVALGAGVYLVTVCSTKKDDDGWQNPYDFHHRTHKFLVQDPLDNTQGQVGENYIKHEWEIHNVR